MKTEGSGRLSAVILAGSSRRGSHTVALAKALATRLERLSCDVLLIDLVQFALPPSDAAYHADPRSNPDPVVHRFVESIRTADAMVWATPVYHNSFSGLLKNALDHISIREVSLKVVGLMGHGGNRTTQAVDQLRIVARGLNMLALPAQVCTADEDYALTPDGYAVISENIALRLDRLAREFALIAGALSAQLLARP